MSVGGSRNPPFGLDMPFAEALVRFIGTDRREALEAERGSTPSRQPRGPKLLTWQKDLSITDAQQDTTGGKVPYLRLTKGTIPQSNWQNWFRDTFFKNAAWGAGVVKNEPVEQVTIPFQAVIGGLNFGPQAMTVTHQPARGDSHSAPSTWIHWSVALRTILEANDFTGRTVVLTRDGSGAFALEIQ